MPISGFIGGMSLEFSALLGWQCKYKDEGKGVGL